MKDEPTITHPSREGDSFDLTRSEVRERSLSGVFFVTASGFANAVIGFAGNLVLARLLTPADFGVVAVGTTVTILGSALADGGLGSGMLRRPEAPTRAELRTLNGIQLVLAVALFGPIALVALQFGRTGAVTALMIAAVPIAMLATPGRVVLARTMRYDRQALADSTAQTSFYVASIPAVAFGAGVWGLAAGTVVRAAVGMLLTAWLSLGFLLPSLRGWRRFGPLVRFGLKFQTNWFLVTAREQGINLLTAAVGGVSTLGLWTLAMRLLQVPQLAFTSLYTVGFPAMSNLLGRGEDPGPVIKKVVRRTAIGATLVFPAFAATSPELVPSLFGEKWRDTVVVIPIVSLSTVILSSISVAAWSYLNAAGRPGVVAWATAAFGIVWIGVTAVLLPFLGLAAIGIGNLVGALVEAALLDRAVQRHTGVAPYRPLIAPLLVALTAGGIGVAACLAGPAGLPTALAAGALALGLCIAGLWVACRADFKTTLALGSEAIGTTVTRARRSA